MKNSWKRIVSTRLPLEIEFGWFSGERLVPFSIVILDRVDVDFMVLFYVQIAKFVFGLYYSD